MVLTNEEIFTKAESLSASLNYDNHEIAVILAAGHGKRIKSHRSKMLHSIWGVPTVERVYNSCKKSDPSGNTIIVVGIKASDVMDVIGTREFNRFAYQAQQNGTGHAVQVALEQVDKNAFSGVVYVLPGDMGLLDDATMTLLRESYKSSSDDMMVLTGIFEGDIKDNQYGRIIRVKDTDAAGQSSGTDAGKVIEIMEHKDILALNPAVPYVTVYNGRNYSYTRDELIQNREFNSGVYAFDFAKLMELLYTIRSNNAQNEVYITDLIGLFNGKGYSVGAISPRDQAVVMGFNDKSALKEMDAIYRGKVYDRLKNIIEIDDPMDFFIAEEAVEQIIAMDATQSPLDIRIGKGVYIGKSVKLNVNLTLKKNVMVDGNVLFGKNNTVGEYAMLTTFPGQQLVMGDNVEVLRGDVIKGNVVIGNNCRFEAQVNMTGSDDAPLRIGNNVLVKGTTYIFGSVIEDDITIEHSVLLRKQVHRLVKRNGELQAVRYYLPMPSGVDAIENIQFAEKQ